MKKSEAVVWFLGCYSIPNSFAPMLDIISFEPVCVCVCALVSMRQASWNATYPPVMGSWGSYVGHGGDTYGFLSESGVLSQFNASFSATANEARRFTPVF